MLEELFDGCFELGVFALDYGFGGVEDVNVGFELSVFKIAAVGQLIADYRDAEYHGWVLHAYPVDTGHSSGNGCSDEAAEVAVLVNPWCAVGIGIVGFALQHNGRFVPTTAWHVACFAATDDLGEVFLSAEEDFDVFMEASTTIEAGVDDDALALVVFAEDVGIDGAEAAIVHGFDVDIAETAV